MAQLHPHKEYFVEFNDGSSRTADGFTIAASFSGPSLSVTDNGDKCRYVGETMSFTAQVQDKSQGL